MRVISSGNTYEVFDDTLQTYKSFPAQAYVVRFSKFKGFYLEKYFDIEITEDKVYGVHVEKVDKVLRSFSLFNRSLGVILSGDRGMGKSLFAKMLAKKAIENGMPLIVVDRYIPGIASYIESIDQEVMVLFDEFDKTFDTSVGDGVDPQTAMLSLFDGVSQGKKLFVITCNELSKLNKYLINRPGRFHYHFRFEYPTADEVREYLRDKLSPEYYGEIDSVVTFSNRISLNYDCLRAIAFELNLGYSFKESIADINIINNDRYEEYALTLRYSSGEVMTNKNCRLNSGGAFNSDAWLFDSDGRNYVNVEFSWSDVIFNPDTFSYCVKPENIIFEYDDDPDYAPLVEKAKQDKALFLEIKHLTKKSLHYVV